MHPAVLTSCCGRFYVSNNMLIHQLRGQYHVAAHRGVVRRNPRQKQSLADHCSHGEHL